MKYSIRIISINDWRNKNLSILPGHWKESKWDRIYSTEFLEYDITISNEEKETMELNPHVPFTWGGSTEQKYQAIFDVDRIEFEHKSDEEEFHRLLTIQSIIE